MFPIKIFFLYHNISHIYVALNQAGNLSNSNLECFKSGLCSIIPTERKKNFWDVNIKNYFSNQDLIRIPWRNQEKELSTVLKLLINNKSKINFFSKKYSSKIQKSSLFLEHKSYQRVKITKRNL